MKKIQRKIIYLDNNATTIMSNETIESMISWCNRGSPSADYASAKESQLMLNSFRKLIAVECAFELKGVDAYTVIFTSGASESNCHIITSAVRSYSTKTGRMPHVITSAAEHKSLLNCCINLASEKFCQLTILPVRRKGNMLGTVDEKELELALRPNTCIISIMAANNVTGILGNISALTEVSKRNNIPFHSDTVQLLGKSDILPNTMGIDAFSLSFHKIGGPPGVGALVIKNKLITGYNLLPHICGSQNNNMRGGIENIPGIGSSLTAFRISMNSRLEKIIRMSRLKKYFKHSIKQKIQCIYLEDFPSDPPLSIDGGITKVNTVVDSIDIKKPTIVWISSKKSSVLYNTLLFAVYKNNFCSKSARSFLEKKGVIVGTVSADSSVLSAIGLPKTLLSSVIRISMSYDTTVLDINTVLIHLINIINQ